MQEKGVSMNKSSAADFKVCSMCGHKWESREDFLGDRDIEFIGYQVNFGELNLGIFLFNHSCKSTIALQAKHFIDLYEGQVFTERKTGTDECPEYCLHECELEPCPAHCECAFVREIIQIIKNWQK